MSIKGLTKNLASAAVIIAAVMLFSSAAVAQNAAAPVLDKTKENLAFPDQPKCTWEQWCHNVKNPTDWFTWGGDVQLREYYANNYRTLSKQVAGHEEEFQRYRARVWGTFKLDEKIDLNARFAWQLFTYQVPESREGMNASEGLLDNLNVVFKDFLSDGSKLTVGRQDIYLGDGWLVADGTPGDGSRTGFYDAIRYSFNMSECDTVADLIYINNSADSDRWLKPINDQDIPLAEQNEEGAIVYLTNKSFTDTEISPYFMYKSADRQLSSGYDADIYAPGVRVTHKFDEHWRGKAEGAYEFGSKNNMDQGRGDLNAFGANTQIAYFTNDKLNNNYRLSYEFLSGDRPGTSQNEGFDVLWGRWARWSEIYPEAVRIEGRPGDFTNYHRFGPGWSFNPSKKLEVTTDYYLLFADQNTFKNNDPGDRFSDNGAFRGQLLSTWLKYTINNNIKGHLVGEVYLPGNYYSENRNDIATFVRYELVFTF